MREAFGRILITEGSLHSDHFDEALPLSLPLQLIVLVVELLIRTVLSVSSTRLFDFITTTR